MLTDIQIAKNCKLKPIVQVAKEAGILPEEIDLYGNYKAKLNKSLFNRIKDNKNGKLILVTAINPTPFGEGKTTVTIGLGQALCRLNKKAMVTLREPSLGPVFGIKGGAAGGGYSQVLPMEDINLHFTGDMHAITSANNLLCALVDNSIQQGNQLDLDPRQIMVRRCLDMNDRALRGVVIGLGGKVNGVPREDSFVITVATEVMAILCLAKDLSDLKERLGKILVGYTYGGEPVFACDLKANGAMAALLKDAIKPNLVQTIEGTPAIMHGGPFANIAHGCNSLMATKASLKLSDYVVTEAGFGSDLGAEKFFDIKCRAGGLNPSVSVIVATIRALKYNGGAISRNLQSEDLEALRNGSVNVVAHVENMKKFKVQPIVCINKFTTDTEEEISLLKSILKEKGINCVVCDVYTKGGEGAVQLAEEIVKLTEKESEFSPLYQNDLPLKEKIEKVATEIYHASGVEYLPKAQKSLQKIEELFGCNYPVCIAKTQYSFSDDASLLGCPRGFKITVKDVKINNGAGFVVVYCGEIMTMPGLPKVPSANNITLDEDGEIWGLF